MGTGRSMPSAWRVADSLSGYSRRHDRRQRVDAPAVTGQLPARSQTHTRTDWCCAKCDRVGIDRDISDGQSGTNR